MSAKLTCFLASYASLLPGQLDGSGIPTDAKFPVPSEIEIKDYSAQLKLELGLSMAISEGIFNLIKIYVGKIRFII